MTTKELLYDLTVQMEMGITQLNNRRYRSTRSRRKDCITMLKNICKNAETKLDDEIEREKMYTIECLFSNRLIDELDDGNFYRFITDLLQALKQLSSYNPPIMQQTDTDVKTYIPSRQQREVHQTTDKNGTTTDAIYEMPEVRPEIEPIPERPVLQMPQMPRGRVISSGLTPFR